jgi:hypothetical protein
MNMCSLGQLLRIQKLPVHHPAAVSSPTVGNALGLFVMCGLNAGIVIGEYTGVIKQCTAVSNPYTVKLMQEVEIDAQECGNECRFINDYWGDWLTNSPLCSSDFCSFCRCC